MIIGILVIVGIISLFVWLGVSMIKQSQKDWETLEDLEKRAKELKSKKEIEEFHKEFVEKASKINNEYITPKLSEIYGYIRGLYKRYQT